jgi:histidyl-tRNA synthetase
MSEDESPQDISNMRDVQNPKEPLSTEPYKGVRDFYPQDWSKLSTAFSKIRETLALWGYEEYNASPLERAEIYESKTSEEIVSEQTYTFEDRGDRRVTLRPEMTPTLARMIAAKRRDIPLPLRWFSIPNVFRYERPQRGRLREHFQLNIDIAGIADARADGEIIVMASEVLKALGAKTEDFVVRVSSRALLQAACAATGFDNEDAIRAYSRLLDRKSKMSLQEFETALGDKSDPLKAIEAASDAAVAEEKKKLMGLIDALHERGMTNVVFDPEIVRGFDYYTGMVFEIYDSNSENPRSLFGGGRYDGLVSLFGAEPIAVVGCAMGDVTMMDFLETHGLIPESSTAPQVFIGVPVESETSSESIANNASAESAMETGNDANEFAQTLRASNIRTIVSSSTKNLGDQIKEAVRRGIPYFIAYGEQESSSGNVRIKNLSTGDEQEVLKSDVANYITRSA